MLVMGFARMRAAPRDATLERASIPSSARFRARPEATQTYDEYGDAPENERARVGGRGSCFAFRGRRAADYAGRPYCRAENAAHLQSYVGCTGVQEKATGPRHEAVAVTAFQSDNARFDQNAVIERKTRACLPVKIGYARLLQSTSHARLCSKESSHIQRTWQRRWGRTQGS